MIDVSIDSVKEKNDCNETVIVIWPTTHASWVDVVTFAGERVKFFYILRI